MTVRTTRADGGPVPAGGAGGAGGKDPPADSALSKLQAHLKDLDETSLLRIARAVELARASDRRDPTDEQILECLRGRLRELRPDRIPTFQRAVCVSLEPFLFEGEIPERKRTAWIPRAVLSGWWRMLMNSPQRADLQSREAAYAAALREGRQADLAEIAAAGVAAAAAATATMVREAELSVGRRAELAAILGSDRALAELKDIATILGIAYRLDPALLRVRQAAGVARGRIWDFSPPAVMAARSAYVDLHDGPSLLIEYFFFGLLQTLMQPWQALRLIRVLSTDLSKTGDGHMNLIPTRLFEDLTRTLSEIGRTAGTEHGMTRRVWLMTCARLVSDAAVMIKGLAEEGQVDHNPEYRRLLDEARHRVNAAVDGFGATAVRDACLVLPVKHTQEKGAVAQQEPNMAHAPTEEELASTQAAAMLFVACRKYSDQEGLERAFRSKEADLVHRLQIGINFRVEFLRARMRHPICLAQLQGVAQVLKVLPQTEQVLELTYRVERTIERYK